MSTRWQDRYIGIPFVEASRDISNGGLDCWGYIRYVLMNEAAIELPSLSEVFYSARRRNKHGLSKFITEYDAVGIGWSQVQRPYQQFDILILDVCGPFHVAVVSEKGWFLHVEDGCNSVEERLSSLRWKDRVHSCWRHVSRLQESI